MVLDFLFFFNLFWVSGLIENILFIVVGVVVDLMLICVV